MKLMDILWKDQEIRRKQLETRQNRCRCFGKKEKIELVPRPKFKKAVQALRKRKIFDQKDIN